MKEENFEKNEEEDKFTQEFKYYLEEYYHKLLEINCKNYDSELFESQKGKDGKYFEYNVEEIVEKIYGK